MVKVKALVGGGETLSFPLDTPTEKVLESLATSCKLKSTDLVLCHAGRIRPDAKVLGDIPGLKDSFTVFALPKDKEAETPTIDSNTVDSVLSSFQTALHDPQTRLVLMNMMGNPESVSKLCGSVPGLREDATAQAVIRDLYLLIQWLKADNAVEILKSHPTVLEALQQMLSSLHAEAARMTASGQVAVVADIFGDAGDSSDSDDDGAPGAAAAPPITQQALAAALAAAIPSPARAATTGAQPQLNQALLSAMLANANAASAANAAGTQQSSIDTAVMDTGLSELAEMGFSDPAENRTALVAQEPSLRIEHVHLQSLFKYSSLKTRAGGNVQGALEYIIQQREAAESAMGLD